MSHQRDDQAGYPDDEINLKEMLGTIWNGKWIILITTLFFVLCGVAYALQKPDIFEANVLVAPADGRGGDLLGRQLGSLASLAGVNIGEESASNTVIAKEVLRSRSFLQDFIRRHHLEVPLMATIAWDAKDGDWVYNREIYNPDTGTWKNGDDGKSLEPTNWDLVKTFRESHLNIKENKENGLLTISVKSLSPVAAKKWADWLIRDINEHMRVQDVNEAEASINYLENKLDETNISGMKQIFYQLIESKTRTVMLANAKEEYVFSTLDPAVIPQERSEPKRSLIVIAATILGGLISLLIVFGVSVIRR